MDLINIVQTGGAVFLAIGLLEVIKRVGIVPSKLIPLASLVVGILICWLGSVAGLIEVVGMANVIWSGLLTGLMACGLYSGTTSLVGK